MAQIQCPNCGGYRTSPNRPGWGGLLYEMSELVISGGILLFLLGCVLTFTLKDYPLLGMGASAAGLAAAVPTILYRRSQRDATKFLCDICGYEWDTTEVQTGPVRPKQDLIQKAYEDRQRRLD